MYWTLELASYLADAPWPATKDELIDYAIRTGSPLEVVENLQDIEDEGDDMSVGDDMTEVQLEDNDILNQDLSRGNDGLPEDEAHSREILLHEIHRAQRANFLHFLLLCSIPIIFLVVVLSSINDSIDCSDDLVFCSRESRAFINAFSSRCMCDAIVIAHHDEYV